MLGQPTDETEDTKQTSGLTPEDLDRTWTAAWNSTALESTGAASMTMEIVTADKAADVTLALDENAFSGLDAEALMFAGTYASVGRTVTCTNKDDADATCAAGTHE